MNFTKSCLFGVSLVALLLFSYCSPKPNPVVFSDDLSKIVQFKDLQATVELQKFSEHMEMMKHMKIDSMKHLKQVTHVVSVTLVNIHNLSKIRDAKVLISLPKNKPLSPAGEMNDGRWFLPIQIMESGTMHHYTADLIAKKGDEIPLELTVKHPLGSIKEKVNLKAQ